MYRSVIVIVHYEEFFSDADADTMKEDVAVVDYDCLAYDVDGYDGGYEFDEYCMSMTVKLMGMMMMVMTMTALYQLS